MSRDCDHPMPTAGGKFCVGECNILMETSEELFHISVWDKVNGKNTKFAIRIPAQKASQLTELYNVPGTTTKRTKERNTSGSPISIKVFSFN